VLLVLPWLDDIRQMYYNRQSVVCIFEHTRPIRNETEDLTALVLHINVLLDIAQYIPFKNFRLTILLSHKGYLFTKLE